MLISKNAIIYRPELISLGNNVRIDDYAILQPSRGNGIDIADFVHISANVYVGGSVTIGSFSNLSFGSLVFSRTDDISGNKMVGACVDAEFTFVLDKPVVIETHVFIGPRVVVLPGSTLQKGVAVGACSLVKGSILECLGFYAGIPCRKIKNRNDEMFILEYFAREKQKMSK